MIDPREEFKDIIRELAQEETKNILQNEDMFRNLMGTIVGTGDNNRYHVDVVTTIVKNVINQTGIKLNIGDTVVVAEKYGSNFSNCYISAKAGGTTSTLDDAFENEQKISSQVNDINSQLGEVSFKVDSKTNRLKYSLDGENWIVLAWYSDTR